MDICLSPSPLFLSMWLLNDPMFWFKIEDWNFLKKYGHERFENHNQIRWHRKLFWTLIYRSLNALQKILEEDYFFLDVVCISSVHLGMAVDCVYLRIDVKFGKILVFKIYYSNVAKSTVNMYIQIRPQ